MGSLDPKIDKQRVWELLRAKGATKASVQFSGGHDEGGTEMITLTIPTEAEGVDPIEQDLQVWYCGGYRYSESGQYERLNEWENEDQELSELLQGPVDERWGSWAGDFSAYGVLTWDLESETVVLDFTETVDVDRHEQIEI